MEMGREEALKFFQEQGEDYKVELITDLDEEETISCCLLYTSRCV